ncbi:Spy/CpxP family protein refolding chaperone [Microcoleus sp. FACHB-672]|uniref:Spy/CpxP family protein refolding chaperone n=1 Tax=Microcoleus sp. FACHB-672 TaxID=2692825 RepID=UPI0016831500|nr:hypothetical protein [Microcoleus sp. FACHB-672]MBD2040316.1 hypothetical protein [Microcoleus sp. FACHB-672]
MKSNFTLTLKNRLSPVKLLPLLMATASLTLSASVIPAAFAQSTTPDAPAQQQRREGKNRLNLTEEQKEQMKLIKQAEREQMNNILTDEQKARLEAAKGNRENMRQVFESLNLTSEQQAQIQELRRESIEKMKSILTAEQLQQMEQYRQSRPEGNQQR